MFILEWLDYNLTLSPGGLTGQRIMSPARYRAIWRSKGQFISEVGCWTCGLPNCATSQLGDERPVAAEKIVATAKSVDLRHQPYRAPYGA
jgi:hypothetical protein